MHGGDSATEYSLETVMSNIKGASSPKGRLAFQPIPKARSVF